MNLTDFPQEVVRCRGVTLRKTAEGEITQDTEQGGESCQRDSTVTATVTALNGYISASGICSYVNFATKSCYKRYVVIRNDRRLVPIYATDSTYIRHNNTYIRQKSASY